MQRLRPYNPHIKQLARDLRNHSTFGEVLLWNQLKARQLRGYQFYRQKPLGDYIVDFYCPALHLVIEIDGAYHHQEDVVQKDQQRDTFLNTLHLSVLRFTELEARQEMVQVLWRLEDYIEHFEKQHPECLQKKHRAKKNNNG